MPVRPLFPSKPRAWAPRGGSGWSGPIHLPMHGSAPTRTTPFSSCSSQVTTPPPRTPTHPHTHTRMHPYQRIFVPARKLKRTHIPPRPQRHTSYSTLSRIAASSLRLSSTRCRSRAAARDAATVLVCEALCVVPLCGVLCAVPCVATPSSAHVALIAVVPPCAHTWYTDPHPH